MRFKKSVALSLTVGAAIAGLVVANPGKARSVATGTYVLMVNNDLGIHCTCPDSSLISILPPANTLRAQVLYNSPSGGPQIITDPSKITIEYTVPFADQLLKDPRYLTYLDNANKMYPTQEGWAAISRTNPVSIAGTPLKTGKFTAKPEHNMWVAELIPVFPPLQPAGGEGTFTDAFGDTRQAFPTVTVTVKDAKTGVILAQNTTVSTPVAFANCCTCHREIYKDTFGSYPANPLDSFRETMLKPHDLKHNTDLLKLTQAGIPIRCSRCHVDPAVGGKTPGYPTSIYPQAVGLNLPIPNSSVTLSYVIHQGHNLKSEFHTRFAALGFKESCEACHPGKETVGCMRGVHVSTTPQGITLNFKCSDCHGDLDARNASGQLADPWSFRTLPRCDNCHTNTGEWTTAQITAYNKVQLGGAFLNSRGHAGQLLLCSSCHGSPHAEIPSKISWENTFFINFNGGKAAPLGKCFGCHIDEGSSGWGVPPHAMSQPPTPTPVPNPVPGDGATLYAQYCQKCHGALATSAKKGRSATQISNAITANRGGMGSLKALSATQISAIATALAPTTPPPTPTPVPGNGASLYAQYCQKCHGALATSAKKGRTATQISNAITTNRGGMGSLKALSATQISAIATALAPTTAPGDGAAQYAANCASCHGALAKSQVRGTSASAISEAIHEERSMKFLSSLSSQIITLIANALK